MNPSYQALLERLRAARRIILLRAIERAGIATIVGLLAVALLALAIALVAPLYRAEYAAIRNALLGAATLFVLAAVVRVWSTKAALSQAAIEAGRLGGDREDELLTALELSQGAEGDDAWTSSSLRDVAVRAAAHRRRTLSITPAACTSAASAFMAARSPVTPRWSSMVTTAVWAGSMISAKVGMAISYHGRAEVLPGGPKVSTRPHRSFDGYRHEARQFSS